MNKSSKQYKREINDYLKIKNYNSLKVVNKYWYYFRMFCTILFLLFAIAGLLSGNIIANQISEDGCEINLFTIKHQISPDTLEALTKYIPLWKKELEE